MFSKSYLCLAALLLSGFVRAGEVEVLHYWTSGGEAAALNVLKNQIEEQGHRWRDFIVAGGGGENAMAELQSRVLKGTPPAAAQIKGLDIQRWARLGFLRDLTDLANLNDWNSKLPPVVANAMQQNDVYVAVPVNVHRTNWLWVNKPMLDRLGMVAPTNWQEFDAIAEKAQAAGMQVIAHGNQSWQHATLFEVVALSIGGADYYRRAFVDHDYATLKSDTSTAIFERYYRLLNWAQAGQDGDEWHQATSAVSNGEALFQFMGDWAKGEFIAAGKQPEQDFLCLPVPGTAGQFLFNIDSFAIFELNNDAEADKLAQSALVSSIMSEEFQRAFNYAKGSIPARTDLSPRGFDPCAQRSMAEFVLADANGALLPSIAHGMATTSSIQQHFYKALNELSNQPQPAEKSATVLAKAIRYAQYLLK